MKFKKTEIKDILVDLGEGKGGITIPDGRYLVNGEEYLKKGNTLVKLQDEPRQSETEKK